MPIVQPRLLHEPVTLGKLLVLTDPILSLLSSGNLEVDNTTLDGDWLSTFSGSVIERTLEDVDPKENDYMKPLNHDRRPGLLPHPSSTTNFDLPCPSSLLQLIEHLVIHVESKGKEKATVTEDVITHDASQAKLSDAVAEGFATQSIEAQNDKTLWLGLECCHCYK
ncbi:hypothetical protein ACHAP3_006787 [Botrytis cinerea]